MNDLLFEKRLSNFSDKGGETGFVLAAVSEALDTIADLRERNTGGQTVEKRTGDYKSWDPEIFKIDKDTEDGYRRRLTERGVPVVLLSEEAGRVTIGEGETKFYVVCDPFDGSWLFKRGIADFWYSSFAFFDNNFNHVCCAVGDAVGRSIVFANKSGAYLANLDGDKLAGEVKLDRQYRSSMGRADVTDVTAGGIESYALKPGKFLMPLVDKYRAVIEPFKFFLPNGGPYGFADVAQGKIDVYFAPKQPYIEIFSGVLIAEKADCVVTDFHGNPIKATDDIESVYDVLCSSNPELHQKVLSRIAGCK